MQKKIQSIIVILLGVSIVAAFFAVAIVYVRKDNLPQDSLVRIGHESLYSDTGYIDYAQEVYFDVENYPDMAEMGLFWTEWDDDRDEMALIDADSAEGAALVDPNKPTIILVHGMLSDGHYSPERFYLNQLIANPAEFDLQSEEGVPLGLIWQNMGWNVGYFHYNRFASEGARPHYIESKIWAIDGVSGIRYRHTDGTLTENATEYSVAEHFAAEYIRAMNCLPNAMGSQEIRVAAHSMGGELSTAGLFLLSLLAEDGQLDNDKLPNRFAMLDPYFSTTVLDENGEIFFSLSPTDITIRWSGKPLPYDNVGYTMIDCLKKISSMGIAIEYYTFDLSTLVIAMPYPLVTELKKLCVYVIMVPNYDQTNPEYSKLTDGHNGVRDWYLCSLYSSPVTNASVDNEIAASASTPTETILALKGKTFYMKDGSGTILAADDTFSQTVRVFFDSKGGNKVSSMDMEVNQNAQMPAAPTKEGVTFAGWYIENNLLQQPIDTAFNEEYFLSPSSPGVINVYAKWIE